MIPILFLLLSMTDPNALCWDISNPVPVDPNSSMVEFGSVIVYSDQAYQMPQDYLLLLSKRWLLEMPVAPRLIEGNTDMFVLKSPPKTKGTLKGFAVWAKFYTGGLRLIPPSPEPPPLTKMEIAAMFMELLFMERR